MKITTTALLVAAVLASAAACGSSQPSPSAYKAALTTELNQAIAHPHGKPHG